MHDVGIALDNHFFINTYRARGTYPADVVAAQVDQHQVFGQFLGIGQQFLLQCPVLGLALAARPGPGYGPDRDNAVLKPDQDLRRGADHLELSKVQVIHIG